MSPATQHDQRLELRVTDEVLRAKGSVSASGASLEVSVGERLPNALERLMPKRAIRTAGRQVLGAELLARIRTGQPLDDSDLEYAAEVFGDAEARFLRRRAIVDRARAVIEGGSVAAQLSAGSDSAPRTADDWVAKYWADAELVDDELLQEIYARILAVESVAPGSCTMRTLRVLRYMDRDTGEKFAALSRAIFAFEWVPRDKGLQDLLGVLHDDLLDLDDAGLIQADALLTFTVSRDQYFVKHGTNILKLAHANGLQFDCFPLTQAGRQLSRMATGEGKREHLFAVARWLCDRKTDMVATWAELPTPGWDGPPQLLTWLSVPDRTEHGPSGTPEADGQS